MPLGLLAALPDYRIETAFRRGWGTLKNGDLLAVAEDAGFDAMITADRNIRYRQNLSGRKIAIVELTTSHWETIRDTITLLRDAVTAIAPSGYTTVPLPRPPKRRRPYLGPA